MKLLSWGANTYGQLGQGIKTEQCSLPGDVKSEYLDLNYLQSIVGGGGHTLVLDKSGHVFACGSNAKGQLGLDMNEEHLVFKKINSLSSHHVTQISCGWDSSLAVTKDGELFVWGSNTYGQLGIPKSKVQYSNIPIKIDVPEITSVSSGLRHTVMITKDGKVLVCGNGRKGQLGLIDDNGETIQQLEQPKEVPGMRNIHSAVCGQHHTIVLTSDGRLYGWGDNKHGQLGLNPILHPTLSSPKEIENLPHELNLNSKLFSGWTHIAILTENGKVINWGRNTYGQLGCHEFKRPASWKPIIMDNIGYVKQLAVGSEHNIAILDSGQMISWGWNEHGNCGVGNDDDVRVPTLIGTSMDHPGVLVGSGAGHSFATVH
ncbi:hypothetical protein L9F63_006210 [Diploptera punctata]|uniref:RCC1-like domain-containing protein n=1 Tax=Diploptera punctata TaxID=6984 RepID=A0AAD7ZB29_DIPPU|nr:hypothetical protein L9F63_006210 [Diploptera punctata]